MSDAFERYKDALRRGHAAAQRGRFDEAIAAFQEAGAIAPDEAMEATETEAQRVRGKIKT